jgi:hypothetical protein
MANKLPVARAVNRANDVTSTVYESFTVTQTVVEIEEGEPFTEISESPIPIPP